MPRTLYAMKLSAASEKAEVQVSLAPGAAHARLGVGYEVIQIDDSRFDQRHGSRAASRWGSTRDWRPGARRECARG